MPTVRLRLSIQGGEPSADDQEREPMVRLGSKVLAGRSDVSHVRLRDRANGRAHRANGNGSVNGGANGEAKDHLMSRPESLGANGAGPAPRLRVAQPGTTSSRTSSGSWLRRV